MNLPKNQLTMRGLLRRCWLFSYRTPIDAVRALVPAPLQLLTSGGFAFWNVVFCRVEKLRPAPLPACVGLSYWHVAYRLAVQVPVAGQQPLTGLYFLRSECSMPLLELCGNLLTDFKFHLAHIALDQSAEGTTGTVDAHDYHGSFRIPHQTRPRLRDGSPFASLDEAAAFLKYQPMAFSPLNASSVQCLQVAREEAQWRCRLVDVAHAHWSFLRKFKADLELCWEVEPIEYQWNRGVKIDCL